MDNVFLKVLEATPMQDIRAELGHNVQYTILCAQEPNPERRINLLLDRLKSSSEMTAPQYVFFLLSTCMESVTELGPDFIEFMVESLILEAKGRAMWPDFIKWVCALIHYFCTDDSTLCVFYEFSAPHVAVEALKTFPNYHPVALASSVLLTHFTMFDVEDAVPELTKALRMYTEDVTVCLRSTEALADFTRYDREFPDRYIENCEAFADHKGMDALGSVLQLHTDRYPEMNYHVACIAANVSSAGVLEDIPSTSHAGESKSEAVGGGASAMEDEIEEGGAGSTSTAAVEPSELRVVALLAELLKPEHHPTDGYCSQVLQVFSNFPQSSHIDWDCISSLFLSTDSEGVVLWCIHFLSSVAMNVKDLKTTIYSTGCVNRVLDVMKKYPDNCNIQEVGCSLLSYLSFDSEIITQCITENAGIKLVLDAMKRFSTNEQLLMSACAALSGLTFNNQAGQQEIVDHEGIALILDAMRIGKKPRLQENGCLAIGTMCWNTDLKADVVRLGGVEVIMKALEEHYTNSGVVKNAFRALAQIAFNCEKYRNEMSTNGIIPLIIRGMEHHQNYDRAQMHGCVALSYLSWTNQGNAAQITAHRGYQVVVEAMRNHPNNHEVQEHAARALANISQVSLRDAAAALEQIIASMRRHERCAEVQEEACRAIVTLSLVSPANKDKLFELGGAEVVIAAMKNFPRQQLVQQEACNALAHLAYEHAALNRAVTELNGIELLLSAMRTHADSPKVQLNACGGLSALAFDNPVAQRQIFELGGVSCVIRAMESFERLRMLELGCSALGTLAWNTDIKEQVAVEAVPEILKAMRMHENSPLLQKSTCRAISQFAFNSERNRHLLAEAGAIPLIVNAMRTHLTTEKLVVHALKALTYLCWENVHVAEEIIEENVEEVLQRVVDHYAHQPRVSGEAVHLSKILFRKTSSGGSTSPSIRLVSPPTTSPPISMIPPTPQGPRRHGGGGGGRSGMGGGGGHHHSNAASQQSPLQTFIQNHPHMNSNTTIEPDGDGDGNRWGGGGTGRRGGGGGGGGGRRSGGGRREGGQSGNNSPGGGNHSNHQHNASQHRDPQQMGGGGRGGAGGTGLPSSHTSMDQRFSTARLSPRAGGGGGGGSRANHNGGYSHQMTSGSSEGRSGNAGNYGGGSTMYHHGRRGGKDADDLWDDPSPETFHGNRELGAQNWKDEMKKNAQSDGRKMDRS